MASLTEAIRKAQSEFDPSTGSFTTDRSRKLFEGLKSGQFDDIASQEGLNIQRFKTQFGGSGSADTPRGDENMTGAQARQQFRQKTEEFAKTIPSVKRAGESAEQRQQLREKLKAEEEATAAKEQENLQRLKSSPQGPTIPDDIQEELGIPQTPQETQIEDAQRIEMERNKMIERLTVGKPGGEAEAEELRNLPTEELKRRFDDIDSIRQAGVQRLANVMESVEADQQGEQTSIETGGQVLGQGLALGADVLFEVVKGTASAALPDKLEEPLVREAKIQAIRFAQSEAGQEGLEALALGFEEWEKFAAKNPRAARNLAAFGNLIDAASNFVGVGAVAKGTAATARGVRDIAFGGTKFLGNIAEDFIDAGTGLLKKPGEILDVVRNRSGSLFKKEANSVDEVLGQAANALEPGSPAAIRRAAESEAPSISFREKIAGIRPNIKKQIQGKHEKLKEYFDIAHAKLKDLKSITPLGYAATKVGEVRDILQKQLNDVGSDIGKFRQKVSTLRMDFSELDRVQDTFIQELDRLKLQVVNGKILRKSGRVKGVISDEEIRVMQELWDDMLVVRQSPVMENLIDLRNAFDKKINFEKEARKISGSVDPLSKSVRSIIKEVNANKIGTEQAKLLEEYSDMIGLLDDLNKFVDSRSGAEFLLKRVLSERGRIPDELLDALAKRTGVDLYDDAIMAQLATELFGDDTMVSSFRSEIKKAGLDASDIIDVLAGGGSATKAIRTLMSPLKSRVADPEKMFLEAAKESPTVPKKKALTPLPAEIEVDQTAITKTLTGGGVTISAKGKVPQKGFAYSPYKERETIIEKASMTADDFKAFREKNADLLEKDDHFIGAWYNEADGNVYLDISVVKNNKDLALKQASDSKQIAIFDLEKLEEIKTPFHERSIANQSQGGVGRGDDGGSGSAGATGQLKNPIKPDLTPNPRLKGELAEMQEETIQMFKENKDLLVDRYIERHGNMVNTDDARIMFTDDLTDSDAVHVASKAVATEAFNKLLATSPKKKVVFYGGGSGSGKTSVIKKLLPENSESAAAIWDGTMSSFRTLMDRMDAAVDAGKSAEIVYVFRDPIDAFENGVVARMFNNPTESGRIVPIGVHVKSHLGAIDSIKKLSKQPGFDKMVTLIDNSLGKGNASAMSIDKLRSLSYNKDELTKRLTEIVTQLHKDGKITQRQLDAYLR